MPFPGEEEVIRTEDLKLIFDELLHPLYFVKLSFQLYVITHEQAHFALGNIL